MSDLDREARNWLTAQAAIGGLLLAFAIAAAILVGFALLDLLWIGERQW